MRHKIHYMNQPRNHSTPASANAKRGGTLGDTRADDGEKPIKRARFEKAMDEEILKQAVGRAQTDMRRPAYSTFRFGPKRIEVTAIQEPITAIPWISAAARQLRNAAQFLNRLFDVRERIIAFSAAGELRAQTSSIQVL
jgi:hypothetical protein